ncbi:hypothetical protein [Bradyrhizobium retamae]|uniref:Uncharacterized protein n=1 Tax=Bradyrhizobium retamae TaxID=1300035 RepID=A0A0R3MQ24_9BRAD|nr:hypothetical protein [Bradyrhizobium retamae]KRR21678.1 hypothetical protein CQ13_06405 [Bradyrhizobium retamae]
MFRLFASLVIGGIGISTVLDSLVRGHFWIAVLFTALTAIVLIPGWGDLRKLFKAELGLAAADDQAMHAMKLAAEHARDAASYATALVSIRDTLSEGDNNKEALYIASDALAEMQDTATAIRFCFNWMTAIIHNANAHWWIDPATGENLRNARFVVPTKLMLTVSELSEAMEAHRKSLADDKLPQFDGFTVEMVDALFRIFDLAGSQRCGLGDAASAKLAYNATRADHTNAARLGTHGKAY